MSKENRYFRGPPQQGTGNPPPSSPPTLPRSDALPAYKKQQLMILGATLLLLGTGALLGFWIAPESPKELRDQVKALEIVLNAKDRRIAELEGRAGVSTVAAAGGHLRAVDKARQDREGHRYAMALKRTGAQAAANLLEWFLGRWDQLLDAPLPDDRTGRRAATLSLLVGGMAANLNEGDYVPWQAEFFDGHWLGEVHFDLDGDGMPGKRSMPNPHDGFANMSICHIAMALNLAVSDARILVMPDMHCDRPDSKMSVFLQGQTMDDAITEFVKAVRSAGFLAKESTEKGLRLILIGARPAPPPEE